MFAANVAMATELTPEGLAQTRAQNKAVSLAARIERDGDILLYAADGLRIKDGDAKVTTDDLWHIASNTKSMTATLLARYVEQGHLSFETTMAEIFPEAASQFHEQAKAITLEQLLTHRSGLAANVSKPRLLKMHKAEEPLMAQRSALTFEYLSKKPKHKPGSAYLYSNIGYIIAGAIAEKIGGKPWEELLWEEVLTPLGIKQAGFGTPGLEAPDTQPWGHMKRLFRKRSIKPDYDTDNPPVYRPSGGLHITLNDWALYAREHLMGALGKGTLLTAPTYKRLHAPLGQENYAMGWGELQSDGSVMLQHAGSNTMWFAIVALAPACKGSILVVSNDGTKDGQNAVIEFTNAARAQICTMESRS